MQVICYGSNSLYAYSQLFLLRILIRSNCGLDYFELNVNYLGGRVHLNLDYPIYDASESEVTFINIATNFVYIFLLGRLFEGL